MEVEDWQDPRSSPPSAEDEEDEVVTFNIGGHHVPASLVSRPGMPNKENETGVMCGTPDKMGSVPGLAFEASAPPTGSSLPRTPQQEPACRPEAARHVPPSPALPAAGAEVGRTPLGPSKSAGLHNQAPSPKAAMASPVPGAAANVTAEDRTPPTASRRLSSSSSSSSSTLPLGSAATAPKSPLPSAAAALPPPQPDTLASPRLQQAGHSPAPPHMGAPKVTGTAAAPATPTALQAPLHLLHGGASVSSSGGVRHIVTAIEARTTQLLQSQLAARRTSLGSQDGIPGSLEAESTQEAEEENGDGAEGAARRLSAGLSQRYESSGEHCPRYSQREVDIIINKRLDDLRATYEAKLRATTEQCMDAQARADAAIQAHMQYQVEINQQLETTWADYERRAQEAEGKLASKDWQLNAVTQQAQDLCSKVAQLEGELSEARKKLEEAAGVEERLTAQWTAKLEAEKTRRRKDVQEMKELVSSRAKEQFAKAQDHYKQLASGYSQAQEEVTKLSTQINQKEQALASATAAREQALGAVSGLEQEVASLKSALAAKDLDIARLGKEIETRGDECRLLLDKEIQARDNAIRDREQALDSLSRTAITLQDYKRRLEELQLVHDRSLIELAETKAMAEELIVMLEERKEPQHAAMEQKE